MKFLVPDTSLAWNFHAVGRIGLIETFVTRSVLTPSSAEWGLEVEQEVLRHIGDAHRDLQNIFGDPVKPTRTERSTTHNIRENVFRGTADDPRMHMGEAETIAVWSERASIGDAILCLTEDKDFVRFCWRTGERTSQAATFAGGRMFVPVTTADVLASCEAAHAISASEATILQQAMRAAGRPFIGPAKNFR